MTPYRGHPSCPSCGTPLAAAKQGGMSFERCPSCAGIWMIERQFLELLRASDTAQHVDELMEHNDGSKRRPCPVCRELMNLAWKDFLKLDRCPSHGVWLDAGELKEALNSKGAWDSAVAWFAELMKPPSQWE